MTELTSNRAMEYPFNAETVLHVAGVYPESAWAVAEPMTLLQVFIGWSLLIPVNVRVLNHNKHELLKLSWIYVSAFG